MLAIKQTVYRTSDDSPLVPALIRAAERGKQAVCLVELKARFDERANIQWARALEEAACTSSTACPALKTHAKCVLVVRREGDGVRHYVHIGTGNYHPTTARLYTDFGLFTCDDRDRRRRRRHVQLPHRLRAPAALPQGARRARRTCATGSSREIERTIAAHAGGPAGADRDEDELARRPRAASGRSTAPRRPACRSTSTCAASAACGPACPGVSENIRVVSIVGRFLEHSRIYAFERDGEQTIYIGSADLMPRNLDTRVELLDAGARRARCARDLLDTLERCLADDTNAWDARRGRRVDAPRARPAASRATSSAS